jgi:hypothetical protein
MTAGMLPERWREVTDIFHATRLRAPERCVVTERGNRRHGASRIMPRCYSVRAGMSGYNALGP